MGSAPWGIAVYVRRDGYGNVSESLSEGSLSVLSVLKGDALQILESGGKVADRSWPKLEKIST